MFSYCTVLATALRDPHTHTHFASFQRNGVIYMTELRAECSKWSANSTLHVNLPLSRGLNGKRLIRRYDFVEILWFMWRVHCTCNMVSLAVG